MTSFVVDASVVAKWFFPEEHTPSAMRLLERKHVLHAPEFLRIEIDNVLCKHLRRGFITRDQASRIREIFRQYPIQHHLDDSIRDGAYEIAAQTGQTVYDCLYLALALVLDVRLVTADRKFYDALGRFRLSRKVVWIEDLV